MFKTMLMGMMILALTSIAAAQSGDYKRLEFFAGYSHNRTDTGIRDDDPGLGDIFGKSESFHGFETSVTGNVSRYVGLKFDFSTHFRKRTVAFPTFPQPLEIDWRLYNFLGGVQVKDNSSEATFKPFAHALAGVANSRMNSRIENVFRAKDSDTGPAGAFGGGIDIRVSRRFDIRAIQLDYNPTKLFDDTQHNFRTGVGIVLH
jgi:hypothetical protein